MTETMIYDKRVAHLEERMSYGTLGICNQLAIRSDDSPNMKRNILLVNGGTIIRNCYDPSLSDKEIVQKVAFDYEQLRLYFETYTIGDSHMLIYFQPDINKLIPENFRKKETHFRTEISRLIRIGLMGEALKPNILTKLSMNNNVTHYGLFISGIFAYRSLSKIIQSGKFPKVSAHVWMVTHCPIDYFLAIEYPSIEFISSHTGKILHMQDIPYKIFKDDSIPFNRITYKCFGDSGFIKAACRNKPKALQQLQGIKLKLKTEREIAVIAKTKWGIYPKELSWDL